MGCDNEHCRQYHQYEYLMGCDNEHCRQYHDVIHVLTYDGKQSRTHSPDDVLGQKLMHSSPLLALVYTHLDVSGSEE